MITNNKLKYKTTNKKTYPIKLSNSFDKIALGLTTSETMQQFLWGIHNLYRLVPSSVIKDPEMTVQVKSNIVVNEDLGTKLLLIGRQYNNKIIN